jgi:hypothetical protein
MQIHFPIGFFNFYFSIIIYVVNANCTNRNIKNIKVNPNYPTGHIQMLVISHSFLNLVCFFIKPLEFGTSELSFYVNKYSSSHLNGSMMLYYMEVIMQYAIL